MPQGNNGCGTGHFDYAFDYVRDNRGIDTEAFYPLENKDRECRYKVEGYATHCTGNVVYN